MNHEIPWVRFTELHEQNWAEFLAGITDYAWDAEIESPRRYPGYPFVELPKTRARYWPSLDTALRTRECCTSLAEELPTKSVLAKLLGDAHGVFRSRNRGPTPSAGGLQALELYLVHWGQGWLAPGAYHYDRLLHGLAQVVDGARYSDWRDRVPALEMTSGGALLFLLVGDTARATAKYGIRAERFLLLEAGHLMQNLCLISASLSLCTTPLGACFEQEIAEELQLPASDIVLYAGVCGGL